MSRTPDVTFADASYLSESFSSTTFSWYVMDFPPKLNEHPSCVPVATANSTRNLTSISTDSMRKITTPTSSQSIKNARNTWTDSRAWKGSIFLNFHIFHTTFSMFFHIFARTFVLFCKYCIDNIYSTWYYSLVNNKNKGGIYNGYEVHWWINVGD